MISKAASSFWRRYGGLPEEIQCLTERNYRIWLENQRHPSLRFKPFRAGQWSVRIGDHYRAVGYFHDDQTFVWTWIGTHEEYNKL